MIAIYLSWGFRARERERERERERAFSKVIIKVNMKTEFNITRVFFSPCSHRSKYFIHLSYVCFKSPIFLLKCTLTTVFRCKIYEMNKINITC